MTDLTKDSPLLTIGGPAIESIYWPGENEGGIELGKYNVTDILAYSDSGIVWLEGLEGAFTRCRIPANQVSIYFKKPEGKK